MDSPPKFRGDHLSVTPEAAYQALSDHDDSDSETTSLLSLPRVSTGDRKSPDDPARRHPRVPDNLGAGESWETLSVYQRKSVLVNRALDEMGMGRYQWCIFFLCGAGYFLDLAWAHLFGLIASRLAQEFGMPKSQIGYLFTAFSIGLTVGACFWGLMTDIYGRKWCFNLTCLVSSVSGILIAAPNGFAGVAILTCLVGFGVGGNIPIDATVTLEFLPTNRRWLLAALSTFQPLGVVTTTLIAYGFIPAFSCDPDLPACRTGEVPCCTKDSNMGWRHVALTVGCITLGIFLFRFVLFNFRESPKWLLTLGKDQEAIRIIHSVAAFNERPLPDLTLEDFEAIDAEAARTSKTHPSSQTSEEGAHGSKANLAKQTMLSHLSRLNALKGAFDTPVMAWLSFVLFMAYISLFWAFSIAGGYLPVILADKGVDLNQSLEQTYRSYIWIYLPGVVGTLTAAALMEVRSVGRRWGMVIGSGLMALTLFCYPRVNSLSSNIALNSIEYVMQSLYGALLYAFTPEAFPAPLRASACGILSTCGRLSSIAAPSIAAGVYAKGSAGVLYLAGGGALVSTVAIALVPFDTKGKQVY